MTALDAAGIGVASATQAITLAPDTIEQRATSPES
jgi:hypothetical protein